MWRLLLQRHRKEVLGGGGTSPCAACGGVT